MSEYYAKVVWQNQEPNSYQNNQYSRAHQWFFDGGITVAASSSPHIVPLPYSDENAVDPEEAYVASLSSCHMLFFLNIARKQKWVVSHYEDNAVGTMEKDEQGRMAITTVTLKPKATFIGATPNLTQLEQIHHQAHDACFIANSVKTQIITDIQQ